MPFLFRFHYSSFTKTNVVTSHVQGVVNIIYAISTREWRRNLQRALQRTQGSVNSLNGTWRWQRCQPYTPAAFTPQEIPPVLISVRSWADPRAIVLPEGPHGEWYLYKTSSKIWKGVTTDTSTILKRIFNRV